MFDFLLLAQECAPDVHQDTMKRIAHVESSFNPYAIGVVGGRLDRQPRTKEEAIATARRLEQKGYNYSVGYVQVNKKNFSRYGLTLETAFDACPNLRAGGEILKECFLRASKNPRKDEQQALRDAFSCYYSGNFTTGYKQGYVLKVVSAGAGSATPKKIVPELSTASISKQKNTNITITNEQPQKQEEAIAATSLPASALLF